MGAFSFLIIVIVLILLVYYIIYPYPLLWVLKTKYAPVNQTLLFNDSINLNTLHFTSSSGNRYTGNLYSALYNGAVPNGDNVMIWFHGGAFIDGTVTGKPKAYDYITKNNIQVLFFDYPARFKFTQSESYNYMVAMLQLILQEPSVQGKKLTFAGDSAGVLYMTLLVNNILTGNDSWGTISNIKLESPVVCWAISGFFPNISNGLYRAMWEWYGQRSSSIKYDNKKPIVLDPAMKLVAFGGTKDKLFEDSINIQKANPTNCMVYEYPGENHEFVFANPESEASQHVLKVITDGTLGNAVSDPTYGINILTPEDPPESPPENGDDDPDNPPDNGDDDPPAE